VSEEASLNAILHSQRWGDTGDYLARPLDEVTLRTYEARYGTLSTEVRHRPPLSVRDYLEAHAPAIEPLPLASILVSMAEDSLAGLETAKGSATRDEDEFARFADDNRCIVYLAHFYEAKLTAAIAKGKYDATGDFAEYDKMLEFLRQSVVHYRKLADLASLNYRQGSDLGEWHSWNAAANNFENELAFYRNQRALGAQGGDLVYLGLDGPMSNASNAFHWLLENKSQEIHWSSESYAFGDSPFQRAKLVVVYDLGSPDYLRYASQLQAWVEHGGKLLFWDVNPSVVAPPLLDGLLFRNDSFHQPPNFITFQESGSPLLLDLSGSRQELDPNCGTTANIVGTSGGWQELAYTVLPSVNLDQIQWGYGTFGPRWTSTLNSARRPVLVSKKFGDGEILLAEMGNCNILPAPGLITERTDDAPLYLREFINNIVRWSQQNTSADRTMGEK